MRVGYGRRNGRRAGIAVAVCVVAVLTVSGCGGSSDSNDIHIAFLYASSTQNAFQEMALGAEASADKYGADFTQAAPSSVSGPQEVQLFQSQMQKSKDGIAVETTTPGLFLTPFKRAVSRGIPIISVDNPAPAGSGVDLYIANDNEALGRSLAHALLARIPKTRRGYVVIANDVPGLPVMDQRVAGMRAQIEKERPDIKILRPFKSGVEPTQNYNNWSAAIKAHPKALAYLGPGDQDAVSVAKVAKATGRHYLTGATDVDPVALQDLQKGYIDVLVDPEHWLKGYVASGLLAKHAKSDKALPKGWWDPGFDLVTKKNVAEILHRQKNKQTRVRYYRARAQRQLANPKKYLKTRTGGS